MQKAFLFARRDLLDHDIALLLCWLAAHLCQLILAFVASFEAGIHIMMVQVMDLVPWSFHSLTRLLIIFFWKAIAFKLTMYTNSTLLRGLPTKWHRLDQPEVTVARLTLSLICKESDVCHWVSLTSANP